MILPPHHFAKSRPPLRYYGGKWRLASWIISHFPAHENYVEPFGGAAGVLMQKPRSRVEVYNDLDDQVVNFFECLRAPASRDALILRIALTPFSRREFERSYLPSDDPVERAARFVVRCHFGHGTCSIDVNDSNGFRSCDVRAGKSYAREWAGIPHAIAAAALRFTGVTIEHLDFRKIIPKFDTANTLYYIDPPYRMTLRSAGGKGYVHELADHDHEQLAWLLRGIKGKVILSTYPCDFIHALYAGWHRVEKRTTANGQRGAVPRTEVLYLNFTPQK